MPASDKHKPERRPHWFPDCCECCNLPFNSKTWTSDWSLSGELTWCCPRCSHSNYPTIGNGGRNGL
jgi:hypothetical protein